MEQAAITILDANRLMAISTVPVPMDGRKPPSLAMQTAASEIYFLIFRASQKYANIQQDNRISISVAPEPEKVEQLKAVYAGAIAQEITVSRSGNHALNCLWNDIRAFRIQDP